MNLTECPHCKKQTEDVESGMGYIKCSNCGKTFSSNKRIMKSFEIKNISGSVKDVDTTSRRVKVVMSEMGSKDLDNEVVDPKAYDVTIKDRGPKGANLIWHLTDHYASLKSAIGKPKEISVDGNQLIFITDIPNTSWGNDMMEFYNNGSINQHSIGYRVVEDEIMNPGKNNEYRLLKQLLLFEGSAVLWGANPNTPTLTVGKAITKEELEGEWKKTMDEFGRMNKMFKTGSLTDQSYELIELKISQLTEKLQQLFTLSQSAAKATGSNSPADTADGSGSDDLLEVLTTFSNKLKTKGHGTYSRTKSGEAA